ncbi:PEP-CTERM sorting domain-containing protein [Desulfobacter latus]|uniref:PEP-CTERM sorting domain-containing protein n=1 Tax=Desulfobacter latus TaxID=2292 RepID=A0A850SZW5_9BACT|nr:PEP-CTERM sorting domain-containing protein [Desulfobacter latus]
MQKIVKWIQILCCINCISFLGISQSWATTLSFDPSSSSILAGESIDVDIVISGLDPENLAVFDLNVNFDPTILSYAPNTGCELGEGLGLFDFFEASDESDGVTAPGTINLAVESWIWPIGDTVYGDAFFSDQASSLTLATLTFTGLAAGNSSLSISDVILGDENGASISITSTDLGTGSIEVSSPAPEPSTMILFGIGLLGFSGIGRRKTS